ncbi:30S ribosomal protein S4 [Verrucomicrobia bacterium LW23]|nr:30S ribosomal protein S4 [Verrucomicrobia bacterium LW23]
MSRYTGPRTKKSRRYGVLLYGPSKSFERKNYPPGVHGEKGRRKQTDFALGLAEKQKLRLMYGLQEKQFRRYYEIALSRRGITGETMLQLLESRLDNQVYRLGFASTRRAARQMVSHGHVTVNGRKVTIASYLTRVGEVISVRENAVSRQLASKGLEATQVTPTPDWLQINKETLKGEIKRVPSRDEIAPIVNEQLIVEFYSR